MRTTEILSGFLHQALNAAVEAGYLPGFGSVQLEIERPRQKEHGDYASGVAFLLARSMGKNPMEIAEALVEHTAKPPFLSELSAVRPGFINFRLSPNWLQDNVATIEKQGASYGSSSEGSGQRVQVEFISANPNGPLHIGHARGAVIGSALANLLRKSGHEVECEYYVNDGGTQMRSFAESLYARAMALQSQQAPYDADAYPGPYMDALAAAFSAEIGAELPKLDSEKGIAAAQKFGLERALKDIAATAEKLNVQFDEWFSERTTTTSWRSASSTAPSMCGGATTTPTSRASSWPCRPWTATPPSSPCRWPRWSTSRRAATMSSSASARAT